MARKFLTNIDLNTNELQNAVIQNLSSAPNSGNKEGRIYYDTNTSKLRIYRDDAVQGSKWYDISIGGASASSLELTGDVTGSASVDVVTGKITLETTVVNNSVALGDDTTGDYVQQVHGTTNQISVDYESGEGVTATISLPTYIEISNGEMHLGKTEYWKDGNQYGIIASNSYGDAFSIASVNYPLQIESHTGNIQLLPDSGIVDLTSGELHTQKTEYWRNGSLQGVVAAQSDNSLRLTATGGQLQLETNSGDVKINPSSTITWFNNNLNINGDAGTISTDVNSLHLNADNGVITTDAQEFHTTKVELWNGGDTSGSRLGLILAHPSDGSLSVVASNQMVLESHSGGIFVNPQNGWTTFNGNIQISSEGEVYASQGDLTLSADSGNVIVNNTVYVDTVSSKNSGEDTLTIHGGYSNIQLDNNTGNIVLNPDGIVSVSGNTTFDQNVTITGDLNVNGKLNAVNRTEINIEDNTIRLNTGFTGAPVADAGIIVERGTSNDTAIIWNETDNDWTLTNDGDNYYAIARKFVSVVGDGSNTAYDVVHNLGTRDVTVQVYQNSSAYDVVETDIQMKDANTVTVSFAVAPSTSAYKVVIIG